MELKIRYAKEKKPTKCAFDVFEVVKVDLLSNTMKQIKDFICKENELSEEVLFLQDEERKLVDMYVFINGSKLVVSNGDYLIKNICNGNVRILSFTDSGKAFNETYEFITPIEATKVKYYQDRMFLSGIPMVDNILAEGFPMMEMHLVGVDEMKRNETKISTTIEKIIALSREQPKYYDLLSSLFPQAFEDERVFCKVGSILRRKKHPNDMYALFKWNGEIRLLNITRNNFWSTEGKNNFKVSKLKDSKGETVTYSEFKTITGLLPDDDFEVLIGLRGKS